MTHVKQIDKEERERRGQGARPIFYHIPTENSWISAFSSLFFYHGGLTWLWVHWRSLPWISLELNAFYREDGCSWNKQRAGETMCAHFVYVQHVRLYVLTVCKRLNLLPKASKIRLSQSILGRYTLLSLKLQTHSDKEDINIQLFILIQCIRCICIKSIHNYEQCSLPAEALTASHDRRCLSCLTKHQTESKRRKGKWHNEIDCQCGQMLI